MGLWWWHDELARVGNVDGQGASDLTGADAAPLMERDGSYDQRWNAVVRPTNAGTLSGVAARAGRSPLSSAGRGPLAAAIGAVADGCQLMRTDADESGELGRGCDRAELEVLALVDGPSELGRGGDRSR